MNCKNCHTHIGGKYCNHCGQKANTNRLSIALLFNQLLESLLQVENGILYTTKELSLRPGHAIRDYLNGKRKRHFKPLSYILLISTAYVLITTLNDTETYLEGVFTSLTEGFTSYEKTDGFVPEILMWLSRNFTYTNLLFIPIFSLASYLLFKKHKYYYAEHLVLNIYVTGHQTLMYMILGAVFTLVGINNTIATNITLISVIVFHFWSYIQFFDTDKPISTGLRIIATYVLNFILSVFFLTFLIFIAEVILKINI